MSEQVEQTGKRKPDWCPYPECQFILQFQEMMCVGKLPEPEPHDPENFDAGMNTHRQCLNEGETGHGIHDLQLNRGDAWLMKKLLDQISEPIAPPVSRESGEAERIVCELDKLCSSIKTEVQEHLVVCQTEAERMILKWFMMIVDLKRAQKKQQDRSATKPKEKGT